MYNGYNRCNKGVEPPFIPPVHEICKGTLREVMGYGWGTLGVNWGYARGALSYTCTCASCVLGIDTHGYTMGALVVRSKCSVVGGTQGVQVQVLEFPLVYPCISHWCLATGIGTYFVYPIPGNSIPFVPIVHYARGALSYLYPLRTSYYKG